MFKPALARGEIQCIGATTLDEYRQYIEKDGALERRFQKVLIEATTAEETLEILNNIRDKYEDHHLVHYTDEALKACISLTERCSRASSVFSVSIEYGSFKVRYNEVSLK